MSILTFMRLNKEAVSKEFCHKALQEFALWWVVLTTWGSISLRYLSSGSSLAMQLRRDEDS
jgi:hypothetical protein